MRSEASDLTDDEFARSPPIAGFFFVLAFHGEFIGIELEIDRKGHFPLSESPSGNASNVSEIPEDWVTNAVALCCDSAGAK